MKQELSDFKSRDQVVGSLLAKLGVERVVEKERIAEGVQRVQDMPVPQVVSFAHNKHSVSVSDFSFDRLFEKVHSQSIDSNQLHSLKASVFPKDDSLMALIQQVKTSKFKFINPKLPEAVGFGFAENTLNW